VDYYGEAKMAYYWTKKAYEPVHVSMKYKKLNYLKGETFSAEIYMNNSLDAMDCSYTIEVLDPGGKGLFSEKDGIRIGKNTAGKLKDIHFKIENHFPEIFFVRLYVFNQKGKVSENTYIFSTYNYMNNIWKKLHYYT
jgi:beta-mannosidase